MRIDAATFVILFAVTGLAAQAPAPSSSDLAFDVISIKPNKSGNRGETLMMQPGGRLTATSIGVRTLVMNAYGEFPRFRMIGGPDWIDVDRFDIAAKAAGESNKSEYHAMLRALLRDRFNFVAHMETRELPIYTLVFARADKKFGAGLRPSAIDCSKGRPAPPTDGSRPCTMTGALGMLKARSLPLANVVGNLSSIVSRQVVDRTGLNGSFDIDLTWSPDQSADAPGPSIFTAVQEQLGLKLESSRGPVEVLVIDHIEPPTPD